MEPAVRAEVAEMEQAEMADRSDRVPEVGHAVYEAPKKAEL